MRFVKLLLTMPVCAMSRFLYFDSIDKNGLRKFLKFVTIYMPILLVVQSLMVTISAASTHCFTGQENHAMDGLTCQPFDHKGITNVHYHHCVLTCIHTHDFEAFIYDKKGEHRMMLSNPCLGTQPHVGHVYHDSKVHGANMGPIWGRQDPGGPHVGPLNLAIWVWEQQTTVPQLGGPRWILSFLLVLRKTTQKLCPAASSLGKYVHC